MHIFISYAKKDTRALARQLRDELAALPGVTAWMDESIEVGGNWPQQIQSAVDSSDLMIVLLSPDVNRKTHPPSFVVNEFQRALRKGKPIVPVLAQQTDIPIALEVYQYIDFAQIPNDGVARVVEEVCRRAGITPPEIKPRVIDLLPPPFEWITIPAGRVEIEEEGGIFDIPTFEIAKYPITNAQYAKFVEAGGYREEKWWTAAGWDACEKGLSESYSLNLLGPSWEPTGTPWTEPLYWELEKRNAKKYGNRMYAKVNGADCPVVGVSWYEAMAFCQWLSETTEEKIMLPTEQQWQRAAQGNDNRRYPWGNEWDGDHCNNSVEPHQGVIAPVTQYPNGASPYGVMGMSGNVDEWCLTIYKSGSVLDGTDQHIVRGGSWGDQDTDIFRAARRLIGYTANRNMIIGFRCARSR